MRSRMITEYDPGEEPVARQPLPGRRSSRLGTLLIGLTAGAAGGMAAPYILPAISRGFQPAMKTLFTLGVVTYEKGREKIAELGEAASDAMAEARHDFDTVDATHRAEIVRLRVSEPIEPTTSTTS